jgi:UDP-glucose 4-epimerase
MNPHVEGSITALTDSQYGRNTLLWSNLIESKMSIPSSSGAASTVESRSSTPRTEPDFDNYSLLKLNIPRKSDRKYILVTGGLGYIGSHTALELLKDGHNVVIIDDLSNSYLCVLDRIKSLVNQHYSQQLEPKSIPLLEYFKVDYGNVHALRTVLDQYVFSHPTASDPFLPLVSNIVGVVHFASFKSPTQSIGEPLAYYRNNVVSFVSFIETLNSYGIKTFIFSSSAAVYGTSLYEDGTIGEESCTHVGETCDGVGAQGKCALYGCTDLTSPYARTKWMCEAILSDLSVSDPEWRIVALRYFNPIGCDSSGLLGEDPLGIPNNLMPLICKVLRGDISHLNVFGSDYNTKDGTGVRDFIHVTDLAVAHIAALNAATSGCLRTRFRTFNVGSGQGSSVLELVEAMSVISGKKIPLQFTTRREGDVAMSVAKPHRAEEELNWKTHRSLMDSCRDTLNFLSKNSMGYPAEA